MKADFQAPNESVRVLARVQEALFVAGAFPDGFYEGAFVADVDLLGFVVEADLQAIGLAEVVGLAFAVHG